MNSPSFKDRREFLSRLFNTGAWATVASAGLMGPLVNVMAAVPRKLTKGRSIYTFKGEVTIDGKAVSSNNMKSLLVSENSIISTGARSRILFAVGKDAHYLRSNSLMAIKGSKGVEESTQLSRGKLLSVFAKRPSRQKPYLLSTPNAVIGIRGTGLYSEAEPELNRSYICTCYGEVNISATADPSVNEDIKATHHDDPRYIYDNDDKGDLIRPAPFKNHTDEELQLIEAIVGRTTAFSSVKEGYPRPRRGY